MNYVVATLKRLEELADISSVCNSYSQQCLKHTHWHNRVIIGSANLKFQQKLPPTLPAQDKILILFCPPPIVTISLRPNSMLLSPISPYMHMYIFSSCLITVFVSKLLIISISGI
jgi:hypothetical protein